MLTIYREMIRPIRIVIAALLLLFPLSEANAGERRWFAGGGLASSSVSGGPENGEVFFQHPTLGPFIHGADLESGGGLAFHGAFLFTKNLGIEMILSSTEHDATTVAFPGEKLDATVTTLLTSARGMFPLGGGFEVFGRAGLGFYDLTIENNAELSPGGIRGDSSFSGLGIGLGGGAMLMLGRIGLELSYIRHIVKLDTLDAAGIFGEIPTQNMTVSTVLLTGTFHFGREFK